MKTILKHICCMGLMMLLVLFTLRSEAGCGPNINASLQKIIDEDRVLYNIPAVQVSIYCPHEKQPRDFVSGATLLDGDIPLTSNHIFQIGSETKSFIAVILLQLEAEHVLSLDDPLGKWLPTLREDWKNITIRQVLNHTSGIYNYLDVLEAQHYAGKDYDPQKKWTSEELLQLVNEMPAYFAVGKGWHYANTNYVLAGMVIEAATGKSVSEVVRSRLIQPLQLKHADYLADVYPTEMLKQVAHGYSARGYFPDEPKDVTFYSNSWANAAGAIDATSNDIAKWFRYLTQGKLLPEAQMRELTTFVNIEDGQPLSHVAGEMGYGLGLFQDDFLFGEPAWWHWGGTLGYMSLMVWLSCNQVIIAVNISHLTPFYDLYFITKDVVNVIQQTSPDQQCAVVSAPRHEDSAKQMQQFKRSMELLKNDIPTLY